MDFSGLFNFKKLLMLMAFFMFAKWWKFTTNFYSLGITFFSLKIFISKFWQFFCCLNFPLNFHYFSHFFPKTISKLWKFKNKKNMLVGEGGLIQLFNVKIVTNLCYFYFYKENESKLYFYIHWHVNSDRFDVY